MIDQSGNGSGAAVRLLTRYTLKAHDWSLSASVFSPDGSTLASGRGDKTILLWDIHKGEPYVTLPCPGRVISCAFNALGKRLAAGDSASNVYILELLDNVIGPIILIPKKRANKLIICCPACHKEHLIHETQLGCEMTCPTSGYVLQLKINTFVIEQI